MNPIVIRHTTLGRRAVMVDDALIEKELKQNVIRRVCKHADIYEDNDEESNNKSYETKVLTAKKQTTRKRKRKAANE